MKDPTVDDPRYVSAFSVYKGLANLKSYQDPSAGPPSMSRRDKKKANKRKGNTENGVSNGKVESSEAEQSKTQNGNSKMNLSQQQQGKKGGQKNESGKPKLKETSSSIPSSTNESTDSGAVKRKKQRKRKKKSKAIVSVEGSNGNVRLNNSLCPSDDDEEPPAKSPRKLDENIVPNPLARRAKVKKSATNTPVAKADKRKNSSVSTLPVKSKQPIVKQIDQTISNIERVLARSSSTATTPIHTAKQNGQASKTLQQAPKDQASKTPQQARKGQASKTPQQAQKGQEASKTTQQTQKGNTKNLTLAAKPSTSRSSASLPHTVTSKEPPIDIKSVFTTKRTEDSISHAKDALQWLIHPVNCDDFMRDYWEKKPLLIKRKHNDAEDYYKWILTSQVFDDVLRRHPIKYGVNLDITSYVDGTRETLSETMQGRVRPAVVWDYYNNGCSVRMLNPQTYVQPLWRLNSSLQEWFGSFVGANMYLTPPDSQGFAPHYDDIDAFILQIEGKKRWKLYGARNEEEKLPRFSSRNFSEETDNLGEPILDIVLEEGDLLYFPRGVIHQAQTVDGEHSLHITLSCNQLNTYGDLLKHHLNHALDKLISKDVNFRKGLPTDYLSFMGIAHKNTTNNELKKKRDCFSKTISDLITKLGKEPTDFAADAMGKKFIWDSLPPYLNAKERKTTVFEDGEFMLNGKVLNRVEFGPETEVKFIRKNCVRLVVEEELIKLYFSTENPLVYHEENDPQYLELSVELAPAINYLISQYPEYTKIEDLPISSRDVAQTTQVVSDLWERGLLFTKEALEPCDYDDFDSEDEEDDASVDSESKDTTEKDDDDDDVESVNLSDLPREGDDDSDDDDDFEDDFYDTTMGLGLDDSDSDDEDNDKDGQVFVNDGDEEVDEEEDDSDAGSSSGFEYGYAVDEDGNVLFDEDDDDEEEDDDEGDEEEEDEDGEEEEDVEDDEVDFDELDRMEETDSDNNN